MTKLAHQQVTFPTNDSDVTTKLFVEQLTGSELWTPPNVAHTYDDEFNSATLDGAWTETFTASGAIDRYASFASGDSRREVHTDYRESWYTSQHPNDDTVRYMHKAVTVPTNMFVWTRMGMSWAATGSTGVNDSQIMLALGATDTGAPDGNNYLAIYLFNDTTTSVKVRALKIDGGASTTVYTSPDFRETGQIFEYFGIQKLGTVYHFWAATSNGIWMYLGTATLTTAVDRAWFRFYCSTAANPGNPIQQADFIRFVETGTGPRKNP